ncbi:ead/Ea22-like family protein [Salmonella enterica]|nr:ead/Ea22-like family protein [Salmonella enterica]EDS6984878.1 ead/Ea22-like family protein [Salmonella enterica subsp. enterica serovar Telelkebir]MJS61925.1 ead/Ea22-like family protein [Salmonella enterica subsp. enterica]EBI4088905.1 ead/Ea22-like family protein [Salmonella enterica]EBL2148839.1 ead/Ea22-like family protein [Salmonella enterica]
MTIDKQALCIENAFDIANQLYELANNEIECDLFAVTSTNENGTEIEFERPITDLALEAASTINALLNRLEAAEKRIAEQSAIVAAAEKLVRCKGRYHSELNYRALAKLFGVVTPDLPPLEHENVHYADAAEVEITALRQRIAELEARTVVVKQFDDFQIVHYGGSEDYAKGYIDCQNNYNKALTAAGIKVKGA